MPTFDTPDPISAVIDIALGDVRVNAGERASTVVEVRPSNPSNEEDVRAAETTRVEYASKHLLVKAPKLRSWLPRHDGGSVDVSVELPAGSHLHGGAASADFRGTGRLGRTKIKTGLGDIELEQAYTVELKSGAGDITVGHVT